MGMAIPCDDTELGASAAEPFWQFHKGQGGSCGQNCNGKERPIKILFRCGRDSVGLGGLKSGEKGRGEFMRWPECQMSKL